MSSMKIRAIQPARFAEFLEVRVHAGAVDTVPAKVSYSRHARLVRKQPIHKRSQQSANVINEDEIDTFPETEID